MLDKQVLLLNASHEVLRVVSWKRAVSLLLSGRAASPHSKTEEYNIVSSSGVFRLPKVLALIQFVRTPYKESLPTKRNIMVRDRWSCQYCGITAKDRAKLTIDHVMPKSRGGDSSWTNLVTACEACNCKKGNKTPKECNMPLKNKPFKPSSTQMVIKRLSDEMMKEWSDWIGKDNPFKR